MKKKKIITTKKYSFLDTVLLKYNSFDSYLKFNIYLKHVLKIIYNFSVNNKTIWFIGFDSFIDINKLKLNSRNIFLPTYIWSKGLLVNKKFVKKKNYSFKNPDLVIVFNFNTKTSEIIKELIKLDIPIIIFGYVPKLSLKSCYVKTVPFINFEKKTKHFCFLLIYSILKKK